jgi:acetyl-CoA carboxylase carboxyltransferase component
VVSLGGYADIFLRNTLASVVVPQISAILGPCAGGAVYSPAITDFVFMVRGVSYMFVTGPNVVKTVTHEEVSFDQLGGADVHGSTSGVAHFVHDSEPECIQAIRELLGFLPLNNLDDPPVRPTADPDDRRDDALLDLVPDSATRPYDIHGVIGRVVDDGAFLEVQRGYADNIVTGFARLGGRPVGIVANQPKHLGGILENDSADKAARFVNLCDAYGIPLLFLMDVPGFMVGTKVEQAGIIRHGAKMLYAVSRATVPKVTVIIRKAYGAGYYVMCGKAYEPDLIVAWPSAEISVMGPEGAVNIIFRKQIEASDDPDAARASMIEGIRKTIDPYIAAGNALIDDIIDPRETRPTVIRALEMAETKKVERPWKKHGVMPV